MATTWRTWAVASRQRWSPAAAPAALAVLYGISAALAIGLSRVEMPFASIWIANAIAIALLLRHPRAAWPALIAAAFAAGLVANLAFGTPLPVSAGWMSANIVEILLVCLLAEKWIGAPVRLDEEVWDFLRLLLLAGLVGPVAGATLASAVHAALGAPFWPDWKFWGASSMVGAITVLPIAMLLDARNLREIFGGPNRLRLMGVSLLTVAAALLVIAIPERPLVLIALPITVAALVLRPLATALVAAVAITCAVVISTVGETGLTEFGIGRSALLASLSVVAPFVVSLVIQKLRGEQARIAEDENRFRLLSQRVQLATKAGGVGLWELKPQTGELWWDEKMRALYGTTPDEPVSHERWARTVHPDDRERAEAEVAAAIAGEAAYDTEFRLRFDDGGIRRIRSLADTVFDENGNVAMLLGTNWDVTETSELTAALSAEKERLRVTLESIGDGVISTDTEARVTFMNRVAELETGWSTAEAAGKPLDEVFNLVDEYSDLRIENPIAECLATRRLSTSGDDHVLINRAGRRQDVRSSAAPIVSDDGVLLGAVLVFQDVTKARQLRRQLAYSATHDALTDLRNRASFERELKDVCNEIREDGRVGALCFIDLDRFKVVNDTAGHAAGDALLRTIAGTIRSCVRNGDIAARLGGDEFALLLRDCPPERAVSISEKIVKAIGELVFTAGEHTFNVGASIGVGQIDGAMSPSEVMSAADSACYEAKAA